MSQACDPNPGLLLAAAPPYSKVDPFRDMAARLSRMGFTGVMMGYDRQWSAEYLREIRTIFTDHGIRIDEVGAYCNLAHRDPAVRRKNIDDIRYAIETAQVLGCRNVASVVGSPSASDGGPHWTLDPATYSADTWNLIRDLLSEIAVFTEGTSVRFLLEPHLQTCMNSPTSLRKMIDQVGHPNLGVVLDPVNMVTPDLYWRTADLINECFDLLENRIMLCHAKDLLSDTEVTPLVCFHEVVPGTGVLDYDVFIGRLLQQEDPAPLMVEHLLRDEDCLRAKQHIDGVLSTKRR